ncbi:Phosphatidylinositol-4-phosphate 3-kinase C2 domain-containing subunit gamma [Chelonia mydas]|uniref:Phosphatidylinositol-4-phosphate 3-kinase C2 domain-containing subunit gamma n=1 Tax=Chelonia mydas TaxID=8469 RepID=M7B9V2_CHEMY|nr:Phosphatidylinositol-4-phosphate 3-kinase C2 domain-containing subunit gamma [Chelonia mydas]
MDSVGAQRGQDALAVLHYREGDRSNLLNFSYVNSIAEVNVLRSTYHSLFTEVCRWETLSPRFPLRFSLRWSTRVDSKAISCRFITSILDMINQAPLDRSLPIHLASSVDKPSQCERRASSAAGRLLKDAQNEAHFKSWYQKLLAAVQFCTGKTLSDEFSKERKLIKILGDVAEKVKAASDPKKQEVLKMEINKLNQFFHEVNVCRLPLNPALVVRGIDADVGDDLRQDMLVLQIIRVMDRIWLQEGLDMQMIIYKCLSTGKGQGLVQMVSDATTLAKIHRESGLIGPLKENTIKKWFSHHHPLESSYQECRRNKSIPDRSAVDSGIPPGREAEAESTGERQRSIPHREDVKDRAPFIFTSEMEYFITEGGKNPQRFQEFVELCCRAYNIVRKHSQLLLNLLEMCIYWINPIYSKMLHAGLPELNSIQDLKYVYDNLRPQDSDLQATSHFTRKIKESLECFPVKLNNLIHTLAQMLATGFAKSTASQNVPQESNLLDAERSIARATILGFSKKPDSNEHVLSFFLDGSKTDWPEESALVSLGMYIINFDHFKRE